MEYFVEQAASHREAETKIRQKYGDKARIMHHKTVRMGGIFGLFTREGVEVTGYFSHEPPRGRTEPPRKPTDLEEEKRKILGSVKSDKTMDLVLKELQSIKEQMGQPTTAVVAPGEHPTLTRMQELMQHNDFTPSYIAEMIKRLRGAFSIEQLEDQEAVEAQLVDWIGDSIRIFRGERSTRPEVFILVGPTGVGKTTTIAKLAALHGMNGNGRSADVRMITIDNYRIGAREQIETYGNIMDIPVASVDTAQEMKKQLALYQDSDVVFVDTIGKSPRQFSQLGEMNEVVRACGGSAQVHLAISATTKTSDLYELLRQFEPFGYRSIIITKLDETTRIGNVISVLHEKQKPVSYLTDGQRVPENLEPASAERLLLTLEEFRINRRQIAQRFANPNDGESNG